MVRRDPKFEGVDIATRYGADLPAVLADPYHIEQVMINIINNAGDALAGARGSKRLQITTTTTGTEVQVEFRDSGPGIADPSRVFDPFYTTKRAGDGTGLGLSLSYGIMEEHGGGITAENVEGGACFTIRLPIRRPRGKRKGTGV
jgi:signal transduction histidine kinase